MTLSRSASERLPLLLCLTALNLICSQATEDGEAHTCLMPPAPRTSPGAALSSVRRSLSKRSPFPFRHSSSPKSLSTSPLWQALAPAQPPKEKKPHQLLPTKPIPTGALFPRSLPISVKGSRKEEEHTGELLARGFRWTEGNPPEIGENSREKK